MTFFLIQKENDGIPTTDLGFETIDAVKYHKWLHPGTSDIEYDYILITFNELKTYAKDGFIPVGSIEFCEEFFHLYGNIHPKAINIPKELMTDEFLGRNVQRIKIGNMENKIQFDSPKFVKNALKIKGYSDITDIIDPFTIIGERETYLDKDRYFKEYLVSDIIDISAEFRCFVYNGNLLDIRRYSGFDALSVNPDVKKIKNMISAYTAAPQAYTMDVAVTKDKKTVLIECHNFWAVGLYGFEYGENLTKMLKASFDYEVKKARRANV